jgi:ADP-ribose pyrophosphatase YjhB (NUDIX family)
VRRLWAHRVSQPAARGDGLPDHRRGRGRAVAARLRARSRALGAPGGFLEVDETATEGAVRETEEEIGLLVEPTEILGLYARLEAAVIVLAYEARIVGGAIRLSPEALEIQAFAPETIPWPEIAFRTTWWALVDWLERRHPDIEPPDERWAASREG